MILQISKLIKGSPFLLELLFFLRTDDRFLFGFELQQNDLHKHLRQVRQARQCEDLNLEDVLFIASCCLLGLQYLHNVSKLLKVYKKTLTLFNNFQKLHIIHRDIKSSNFLVTSYGYIKLADFGWSVNDTSFKEIAGTYQYASPGEFTKC